MQRESLMNEIALRQRARQAMEAGKLPERRPARMWGGRGSGGNCAICGSTLDPDGPELDLEFSDGTGGAATNHHVHVRCFAAWELERDAFAVARGKAASAAPERFQPAAPIAKRSLNGHDLPRATNGGTIVGRERDDTSERGSA